MSNKNLIRYCSLLLMLVLFISACGDGSGFEDQLSSDYDTQNELSYSYDTPYEIDIPIDDIFPSFEGEEGWSYIVSPELPAGLSLDQNTGIISGTPTEFTDTTSYTVTATAADGFTSTASLELTIMPQLVKLSPDDSEEETEKMVKIEVLSSFGVEDTDTWVDNYESISALNQFGTPTRLEDVVADLNHSGSSFSLFYLLKTKLPANLHTGFLLDGYDQSSCWLPQGITGTGDAYPETGETTTGLKLLAIGAHDDHCVDSGVYLKSESRGVQVTFIDVTHMDDIEYRKVLLVEPYGEGESANFKAVKIHAGGMSWVGQYLYVVDTANGFRVFDVSAMLEVDTTSDGYDRQIGIVNGNAFAYGFKYILPQVGSYKRTDNTASAPKFSWMSLDRSTTPASFISGEYESERTGRVFRWSLNADNKLKIASDEEILPQEAFIINERAVQGGFSRNINGTHKYWFTGKNDAGKYYLFRKTTDGRENSYWWSKYTSQTLSYSPFSDNLWSLQEFARKPVWAVKLSDLNK